MNNHQLLLKYWNHSAFRPLQEDIINSVLAGKDTLALLPTGGGKSVCFQLPAMAMEGICIVITPLIALMKDQVEGLKKKGISAITVYSGMHPREIDIALENCVHGSIKFLYLSPERLLTDKAKECIKKMKVNLLAVDEAHCISQWGYDFRPSYLLISDIRKWLPKVPLIALTATATDKVVLDIQTKLEFKLPNVFKASFERRNLTYYVLKDENKLGRLLSVANKVKGCGIVYVRSRRKTTEIADMLQRSGITAAAYHAGLTTELRSKRQAEWMQGSKRIMVATNAFGMGIDKPNVRFVVHLDLPDSIEAYFQEAGRGGRDGNQSHAVLLYHNADTESLQSSHELAYPEPVFIKKVYQALGSFFNVAYGTGLDSMFDFDINEFCNTFNFSAIETYHALKIIDREGYISLSEIMEHASKVYIHAHRDDLYAFRVNNPSYDGFLNILLRSYGGVYTDFTKIEEDMLAKRLNVSTDKIRTALKKLEQLGFLNYQPSSNKPRLIFTCHRILEDNFSLSDESYYLLKKQARTRIDAMLHYVESHTRCRSQLLIEYFGEKDAKRCGLCDVCIKRNKIELSELEFDTVLEHIKPIIKQQPTTIDVLVKSIPNIKEDNIIRVIQWLLDNDKIKYNDEQQLEWIGGTY